MLKILNKVGIEEMYINIIKVIYDKFTANTIHDKKAVRFSSKIRKKTKIYTLTMFTQHGVVVLEVLASAIGKEN